jgi:hypothetical protein
MLWQKGTKWHRGNNWMRQISINEIEEQKVPKGISNWARETRENT